MTIAYSTTLNAGSRPLAGSFRTRGMPKGKLQVRHFALLGSGANASRRQTALGVVLFSTLSAGRLDGCPNLEDCRVTALSSA